MLSFKLLCVVGLRGDGTRRGVRKEFTGKIFTFFLLAAKKYLAVLKVLFIHSINIY